MPIFPLKGIKILDLSRLLPGPFCVKILKDLGCEVLKVSLPRFKDPVEKWPAYEFLHQGKTHTSLDFQKQAGRKKLLDLVKSYDVLVEGFRPGALERLGFGYRHLKKINPGLIYCSITGYGQTGPYKRWAGHDLNYTALSGILGLGGKDQGGMFLQGTHISDFAGALYSVVGILAALYKRQETGQGSFIDISMHDAAFSFNILALADMLNTDKRKFHGSEFLFGKEPYYNVYKTKDNRYMAVASLEPSYRERLLELLGRQDLKGLTGDDLKKALQEVFGTKVFKEWRHLLENKEVCVSGVLTMEEAAENEQIRSRGMLTKVRAKWRLGNPVNLV